MKIDKKKKLKLVNNVNNNNLCTKIMINYREGRSESEYQFRLLSVYFIIIGNLFVFDFLLNVI